MYNHFTLGIKFLKYYLAAANSKGHGTHSPFIFDFITKVLNDRKRYADYARVEQLRHDLLKNPSVLDIKDMGAGSGADHTNQRSVASIAKHAAKPKKYGQLLYRMIKHYQPHTILELGTSLGITTSYLATAAPAARIVTMEGAESILAVAKNNFEKLQLRNIETVEGNFDQQLPSLAGRLPVIDFAFIDGNHRLEPTYRYFQQVLEKSHDQSILVFDDIHWSGEMEDAWSVIRAHEAVSCTIDLFFIGIVFFRPEFKEKQHFTIRF